MLSKDVLEAVIMVAIACFTGWRSHTIVSLRMHDVVLYYNKLVVACSEFKNVGDRALPQSSISFPKLPKLWSLLYKYVFGQMADNSAHLFT